MGTGRPRSREHSVSGLCLVVLPRHTVSLSCCGGDLPQDSQRTEGSAVVVLLSSFSPHLRVPTSGLADSGETDSPPRGCRGRTERWTGTGQLLPAGPQLPPLVPAKNITASVRSRVKTWMLKCGEVSPGPSLLTRTSCQQLCHCLSLLRSDIIHVCGHQIFPRSPGNGEIKTPKMLMDGESVMYVTATYRPRNMRNDHKE